MFEIVAALFPPAALVKRGKNSSGVYRIPLALLIVNTTL
jgi:hypothetical protein